MIQPIEPIKRIAFRIQPPKHIAKRMRKKGKDFSSILEEEMNDGEEGTVPVLRNDRQNDGQ